MWQRLQAIAPSPRTRFTWAAIALAALAVYALYRNPPVASVGPGEMGVRVNRLTGAVTQWRDGSVFAPPLLFDMRVHSLRDRSYQPEQMRRATGPAPLQSMEGLSLGVDLVVRYALDPARLAAISRDLPEDIGTAVVDPALQGVAYKTFARYTVREIFSTRRSEIQQAVESELRAKLAQDGLLLRSLTVGKVDLPAD